MKWYNILAFPFAALYGSAVLIRNAMFKAKMIHTHHPSLPTICVGNLAVGGTGKTPFVEYLIRMLQNDYQIAVLSRGYKRSTHGFVLADEHATSRTIGDEPMQIHCKFPHIPVAVCRDRVHGIHKLQEHLPNLQVVILDDAYQYRRLKCGFYILLTTYHNLYIHDHFLPMGRLRDARQESLRASAIVVTKCPDSMRPIDQRIVENKLHLPAYQQLYFSHIQYPALPEKKNILLVTGIAHPEPLLETVSRSCPNTRLMAFPDHHRFNRLDIRRITQMAESYELVLTTEKDYARLSTMEMPDELKAKLQTVPIEITLGRSENLERQLRQYINK